MPPTSACNSFICIFTLFSLACQIHSGSCCFIFHLCGVFMEHILQQFYQSFPWITLNNRVFCLFLAKRQFPLFSFPPKHESNDMLRSNFPMTRIMRHATEPHSFHSGLLLTDDATYLLIPSRDSGFFCFLRRQKTLTFQPSNLCSSCACSRMCLPTNPRLFLCVQSRASLLRNRPVKGRITRF